MPSILLMEHAGAGAANEIVARWNRGSVLVVCGTGNNGGDGYVVARHLSEAGWDVQIATVGGQGPRSEDAKTMAAAARSIGLRSRRFEPALLKGRDVVVDALLGIGITGAPRTPIARVISALNASKASVVALDVPSGVESDSGRIDGAAVVAMLTLTFHADKVGLHVAPGKTHAGEVVVVPIGIPRAVTSRPSAWLLGPDSAPVPGKDTAGDKYAAGAVLVVAGSPGMTGAGVLAARATLRTGGGLTVAAVPDAVQPIFAEQVTEVMAAPIPDVRGTFGPMSIDAVVAQAQRVGAIALGPGLGRAKGTTAFVRGVLDRIDLPCVIDADGLWHLGSRPTWLRRRSAPTVVTPHSGEAARLLGISRADVDADRLAVARQLSRMIGGVVILKGPGAIIVGAHVAIDGVGTAALSTAGSGDVLTGIVACMLAKRLDPFEAAATAVRVHSTAGELAGHGDGTVAGDLVECLPQAAGHV